MSGYGKVMIITGASSGFGRQAALIAAKQGYRVVAAARRVERLDELVAEIASNGGTAIAVSCDVTNDDDQQRLIDTATKAFGQIDVLVNNAGIPLKGDYQTASPADLRRQWETNVVSLVTLTRRALPALIASRGVVVNIGSTAGYFSVPLWGTYFPTKVAVRSFSNMLRRELSARGVRVALIEPGPFATEFGKHSGTPILETWGMSPEMVAHTIVRMAERPRRSAVVPWMLGPMVVLGGTLASAFPAIVDLVFWLIGKQKLRDQQQQSPVSHS